MELHDFLNHLDGVKKTGENQYIARCPAHDDRKQSLSVSTGKDGQIIACCHAGCTVNAITEKLGIKVSDLFQTSRTKLPNKKLVATYKYSNGAQKLRYAYQDGSKSFSWRQPDGQGGWQYNRHGLPHVLYVRGELTGSVYVVEGEKDADNLHRLGLSAVCSEDGAKQNGKGWRREYTEQLTGLDAVYIIQDNDETGKAFAQTEAAALFGHVGAVYILDLSTIWTEIPNHADISDYLARFGADKTVSAIKELCCNTQEWTPAEAGADSPGTVPGLVSNDSLQVFQAKLSAANAQALVQLAVEVCSGRFQDRAERIALIRLRAREIGAAQTIDALIKTLERDQAMEISSSQQSALDLDLCYGRNGMPLATIENFQKIMDGDPFYSDIAFNVLTNSPERDGHRWTDTDDADSMRHIETEYRLFSKEKHAAALRLLFRAREVHPIQDLVESIQWDGTERCERFLTTWAKSEDSAYTREVSRLIFAGGINRLYLPGCKYDDVPVLVGDQGSGKSTLVRWLALHDKYFAEATVITGQRSIEQLAGAWIVEFAELSAIKTEKSAESVKAYITRLRDRYRLPYDRNLSELPRRCIFIGTTNTTQFLTDQTGGRRFFPIRVHSNGYELHDHERECREYIAQCWAEAREKYNRGEMLPVADRSLMDDYKLAQADAQEDDWRIGKIADYLSDKPNGSFVCILQIFREALLPDPDRLKNPTARESREIGRIMQQFPEWERYKNAVRLQGYGVQKCWQRARGGREYSDELPF